MQAFMDFLAFVGAFSISGAIIFFVGKVLIDLSDLKERWYRIEEEHNRLFKDVRRVEENCYILLDKVNGNSNEKEDNDEH